MADRANRRVVVVGGGLAGLAAAYDLVLGGAEVTVLEAASDFGGLASSFRIEGVPLERFYHFICRSDGHLLRLVDELGLGPKLRWHPTSTAFFHEGAWHRFGTPIDLMRFTPVPVTQRVRFGLHVLRSRYRREWRQLDRIPAKEWLIRNLGREAYDAIWHPLLQVKFGDDHDQISAAWVWHRIWRVAKSRRHFWSKEEFGCLDHGTATLVDALVAWLEARPGVRLVTGARVEPFRLEGGRIREVRAEGGLRIPCDAVVSTVAPPVLDRLVSGRRDAYFDRIRAVRYIGVVCTLLSLREPFSPHFWTNINDRRVSFNGIIEQTNLNRNLQDMGLNLAYIPFYLPTSAPRYAASDQELLDEYTPMLRLVQPRFRPDWIKEAHVFRAPYAQALFVRDFAHDGLVPAHRSSIDDLYVTDSTQFYPEDRTLSAAVDQGRTVARMILDAPARA